MGEDLPYLFPTTPCMLLDMEAFTDKTIFKALI